MPPITSTSMMLLSSAARMPAMAAAIRTASQSP